ncbi:hypothetical protein [Desulfovibrio cuneatus]|uniref:hypothetical protein n=1 Tax=Desulfovibrio cuneatus TaxID=159728 RepID=UPI000487668D|nr:hypothetical protein [Desulfovibrio cuneatus]
MDITNLLSGLSGIGIGTIATLFLKEYLERKKISSKRLFEEKRDAYVAYLNTVARSQTIPAEEALWARTAAMERIRLCGSQDVIRLLATCKSMRSRSGLCGSQDVIRLLDVAASLPPGSPRDAIEAMIQAMRDDIFPASS